jgi:hypothetical protein
MSKGLVELAGFDTLKRVVDFIVSLEKVIVTLHQSGVHLDKILRGKDAHFIAVTAPDLSQVVSLDLLLSAIRKAGFNLESVVINRCPSPEVVSGLQTLVATQNGHLPTSIQRVAAQQIEASSRIETIVQMCLTFLKDKKSVVQVEEQAEALLCMDDYLKFSERFKKLVESSV